MQWKSLPEKVVTSFWKSCNEILEKGEKDGLVGIAVSYDMGWQKRGKGHNSLTGHGTAMGLVTGKVLSYATRCKSCRVCDSSKKSGTGQLKITTAERIMQVLLSQWRGM